MSDTWSAITGALIGIPELPGARCVGKWNVFDNEHGSPELEEYALNLCGGCPAFASCEQFLESLPKTKRPKGVIAGRVRRFNELDDEGAQANRKKPKRPRPKPRPRPAAVPAA